MNYNYKLSKYKNKFLDQFGGGIIEASILNLAAHGIMNRRIMGDKNEDLVKIKNAYVNDKSQDEYEQVETLSGRDVAIAAKVAKKATLEAEAVDYVYMVQKDDKLLFIKFNNDYPASPPVICYNGKNIFNKLFSLNPIDDTEIDETALFKLLSFDSSLLTDELIDSIDDECYYLLPIDLTNQLIKIEESKINILSTTDFLICTTHDEIYDVFTRLVYRYRVLYKLNQRLFFEEENKNKKEKETKQKTMINNKNTYKFILKEIEKIRVIITKLREIDSIIAANVSITTDDANDKAIETLIGEVADKYKIFYNDYNDFKSDTGEEKKLQAETIKRICLEDLRRVRHDIFSKYGKYRKIALLSLAT